jgi:hypothetical protein
MVLPLLLIDLLHSTPDGNEGFLGVFYFLGHNAV